MRDLDLEPRRVRRLIEAVGKLYEEYLVRLPDLPVDRRRGVEDVRDEVVVNIPEEGLGDERVLEFLRATVFSGAMHTGHPGFLAYISGSGAPPGAVADLVAAAINQNVGGWRLGPGATELELSLNGWFAQMFGLPEGAGGLVLSGGSMANFVGLKVARDRALGLESRATGIQGTPLTAYASSEVHFATTRAADMLGLGSSSVRSIVTDEVYRMDMEALEDAINADIAAGHKPFAVIATAGTTATGAIDPLPEVADLCAERGLWMHVDAAYGGPAVLAPDLKPLLWGIERAQSIAFDPHKWLYTPLSGGIVLVRDLQWLVDSFGAHATYVHEDKELTGRGLDLGMMGPQLSRGFFALKIFVSLLMYGSRGYGERIAHDAALARYLAARVKAHDEFELMTPVSLSICCFRYRPPDLPRTEEAERYLDDLNERLMAEVQFDGRVYYSNAVLRDRFVLRCCIVNFRTEADTMDEVVDVTAELGRRLDSAMRPTPLRL